MPSRRRALYSRNGRKGPQSHLQALERIPKEIIMKESDWIVKAILDFNLYKKAAKVAAFYPLPSEPDIKPILKELAGQGRLLLPRTFGEGLMEFSEIKDIDKDLIEGRFHVFEPKAALPFWKGEIPFALIPGVRFDKKGGRYGHGKGYYDRFLSRHKETIKCGVAFSFQVSAKPLELKTTDVLMNYIVAPLEKEIPNVEKATV